jgi:hypothetical protein
MALSFLAANDRELQRILMHSGYVPCTVISSVQTCGHSRGRHLRLHSLKRWADQWNTDDKEHGGGAVWPKYRDGPGTCLHSPKKTIKYQLGQKVFQLRLQPDSSQTYNKGMTTWDNLLGGTDGTHVTWQCTPPHSVLRSHSTHIRGQSLLTFC